MGHFGSMTGAGRHAFAAALLGSTMLAAATAAQAQSIAAAGADSGLGDIVVTAQKREENLQRVPISIQALSTEKLEQHQVGSFEDYAKLLPSVSFDSLGPGQAQLYFRGIATGGDGAARGRSQPATGFYLDEIPLTTIGGSVDLHIYDIARVEALSGPQGTLFGASSLSGTLRLITNKPDPKKFAAGYDVEGNMFKHGSKGGKAEGFVNLPVNDDLAVRLVGFYEHDGGYIDNVPATRTYPLYIPDGNGGVTDDPSDDITIDNGKYAKKNYNQVDTYGGRVALRYDIDDNWSVTPTVIAQHQVSKGVYYYDPKVGDLKVENYTRDHNLDKWYQAALTVQGKVGRFDLTYSGGYFQRQIQNQTDYSDYTVYYDNIGYSRFYDDAGNLIDPTQLYYSRDDYTKLSNEIRLTSPKSDRLRLVVGAFQQRQTDVHRAEYNEPGLESDYVVAAPSTLFLTQQRRVDRDYAIFGEASFDITPKLTLTGGIRGFKAQNTLYGFFGYTAAFSPTGSGVAQCFAPSKSSNKPCINTDKHYKESGETHRVNLQYQIDPDHMVYATYSTGFRPGGANRRTLIRSYDADTLTNYEIGWKTSWLDHHLRINGAAFVETWKKVQYGLAGDEGVTDIYNAGDARVKGVEADVTLTPVRGLNLSASGTYVDAKLTKPFCKTVSGEVTFDCADPDAPKGTRLPITPKLKLNATARYDFATGSLQSFVQLSANHQSSVRTELSTDLADLLHDAPGFTTWDVSAGTSRGNWKFEVYVNNLFDKRGQLDRLTQCFIDGCYDRPRIYPTKPQLIGIRFGQKF